RVRGVEVADVNPHVTVRIHRPAGIDEPGPALLWIHGGGTIMGSAAQEDRFCRKLANFTDVNVVAVGHPLAPAQSYPTPPPHAPRGLLCGLAVACRSALGRLDTNRGRRRKRGRRIQRCRSTTRA